MFFAIFLILLTFITIFKKFCEICFWYCFNFWFF